MTDLSAFTEEELRQRLAALEAERERLLAEAAASEPEPEPERVQEQLPLPEPDLFQRHPVLAQYRERRPAPHPGQPTAHGAGGHSGLAAAVGN